MKPQKFTTEDTEEKKFRFSKSSVNSVASSPRIYFKRSNGTNNILRYGSAFNVRAGLIRKRI